MSQPDQRPKVTIEDLLRLKRSEHPEAEFWTGFERELRQKQLTALLEKRPWWQGLPQMLARHAYLPMGATAILAFTLVSVKYYEVPQLTQPATNPPAPADHLVSSPIAPVSSPLVNRSKIGAPVQTAVIMAESPHTASASVAAVELMPAPAASGETGSPSHRLLAMNFNALAGAAAGFAQEDLNSLPSIPARVQAPVVTDELASVPTDSDRRIRLLASYDGRRLRPEPAPPAVVRERLARRLGETETSDRSNRLARDIDSFGTPMPQIVALRF